MFSPIAYVKFWILFIICLCFSSTGFSASDSINTSPEHITKAHARLSILQKEKDEAASKLEKLHHEHKVLEAKLESLKHPHNPSTPSSLTPPLLHEEDHKKLSGESSASIPGASSIVSHTPETLGSIVSRIIDVIGDTENIVIKIFRLTHKNQALIEKIEKLEGERKDLKEKSAKLAAYSSSASSSSSSTSAASLSHAPVPKPSSPAASSHSSKTPIGAAPAPVRKNAYTSPTVRASQNSSLNLHAGSPAHENARLETVKHHFPNLPPHIQVYHWQRQRRLVRESHPQPHTGAAGLASAPIPAASASSSASASSTPLPETTAEAIPTPPRTNPFINPSQIFSSHEPLSPSEEIMRPSTPPPFDSDELPS